MRRETWSSHNTTRAAPPADVGSPTAAPDDGMDDRARSNNILMDAVVKVFAVHSEPNWSLPWQVRLLPVCAPCQRRLQRKRQYSSTSSGFIISGRRILTNAHSVDHHTQVKVKKRGSDEKYLAQVLAVGTECDIGAFSGAWLLLCT